MPGEATVAEQESDGAFIVSLSNLDDHPLHIDLLDNCSLAEFFEAAAVENVAV